MVATAAKLRNLIKITKVCKASSCEPRWRFKGGASVNSNQRRMWFDSRLCHNAFRLPGWELVDVSFNPQLRHNGTGCSVHSELMQLRRLLERRWNLYLQYSWALPSDLTDSCNVHCQFWKDFWKV